jgi:hypothetical protein
MSRWWLRTLLAFVADEPPEAPEIQGDALGDRFFDVVGGVDGLEDAVAVFEPLVLALEPGQDGGL